jgi:hypothetical protein
MTQDGPASGGSLGPETRRLLAAAFRSLHPEVRAALWLYWAEGESLALAAQALGMTPLELRSRLEEGQGRLEALLCKEGRGVHLAASLRQIPVPPPSPGFIPRLLALFDAPATSPCPQEDSPED